MELEAADTNAAVVVADGVFSYGRKKNQQKVLNGINLIVRKGDIYALLGPSGCGKTTLISCLAQIRTLDKGSISIFSTRPGSKFSGVPGPWLGLMPQELSLYMELTVRQTLMYFGRLHLLEGEELNSRVSFLVDFLELPQPEALLLKLSGGQQRRLSLAVALIHKPPLLLLDEPTVGLDPAISNTIWRYLLHLSRTEAMTILITTHYIEEARKANMVGMMRNGQILVEGNPENLIRQFRVKTLENVFLLFCLKEENQICIRKKPGENAGYIVERKGTSQTKTGSSLDEETQEQSRSLLSGSENNEEMFEMKQIREQSVSRYTNQELDNFLLPPVARLYKNHLYIIYALTLKSLQRLRRNIPFLIFVFCLPCMIIFMVRCMIGLEPSDLPFGVVNMDQTGNQSLELLNKLDGKVLVQTSFESEQAAIRAMQRDLVIGTLIIGENFTESFAKRYNDMLLNESDEVSQSFVHLQMTTTNPVRLQAAYVSVMKAYGEMSAGFVASVNGNPDASRTSLVFMDPVFGDGSATQADHITSGSVCGVLYMVGMACSSVIFLDEFNRGVVNLNRAAGVTAFHTILSHLIIQYTVTFFHIISLTIFVYTAGVSSKDSGSPFLVAGLLFMQTTVGISQGFFLATIIRTMFRALITLICLQSVDYCLAGYMWPIEGNPYWARYLGLTCSPTAANIRAFRYILTRGLGLGYNAVWFAILVDIFWIVVSFLGVTVMLNR